MLQELSEGETEQMAKAEASEALSHSIDKILGREECRGRHQEGKVSHCVMSSQQRRQGLNQRWVSAELDADVSIHITSVLSVKLSISSDRSFFFLMHSEKLYCINISSKRCFKSPIREVCLIPLHYISNSFYELHFLFLHDV